jgi:hypothetical protein
MSNEKKYITKELRLQLFALFTMGANHYAKAQEYESAIADMLGYEDNYCGCISDEIFCGGNFDSGMRNENIHVKTKKAR